jgi:hypothetical protein
MPWPFRIQVRLCQTALQHCVRGVWRFFLYLLQIVLHQLVVEEWPSSSSSAQPLPGVSPCAYQCTSGIFPPFMASPSNLGLSPSWLFGSAKLLFSIVCWTFWRFLCISFRLFFIGWWWQSGLLRLLRHSCYAAWRFSLRLSMHFWDFPAFHGFSFRSRTFSFLAFW